MTSCIHFIRHGITEGILNKWYYGWSDMPLTESGVDALKDLKAQGIYPKLGDADCYTSGMLRANQTFEIIFGNAPFTTIPALKEMNFGEWECKTFDQLRELDGFDVWINDTTGTFQFPGGESAEMFRSRCGNGLEELIKYHHLKELSNMGSGKDTVSIVTCHGGVIGVAMCSILDKPKDTFWEWIPNPGRGYTIFFENGEAVGYETI